MKLKLGQLREWLDAQAREEITYDKVVQNINEFFNPDLPMEAYQYVTDANEPQRLTAEEMLDKYWELTRKDGNEDELSPDEVTNLMTIFARQEVEAKDREWREVIQKRIDELSKLHYGDDSWDSEIYELESLLKQVEAVEEKSVWISEDNIHEWFELSYSQYLTIPRSVLQSMPEEWQNRFVKLLEILDDTMDWRPKQGRYWVQLKDNEGKYMHDPLMDYDRGRRRIIPLSEPPKEG